MLLFPIFSACACLPLALSFSTQQLAITSLLPKKRLARFYRSIDEDLDGANPPNDKLLLKTQARAPQGFNVNQQAPQRLGGGVNQRLVLALWMNQLLILALASSAATVGLFLKTGSFGFLGNLNTLLDWSGKGSIALFDFWPTPQRLVFGTLSAIPLLVLSTAVERSDKTVFANINFSTISMCLTLFGRRKTPPASQLPASLQNQPFAETSYRTAFTVAFLLSGLTGFCEEAVFRRILPAIGMIGLGLTTTSTLLGQALLFALGHVQPQSSCKSENLVLIGLQFLNGIGFGLVYLLTDLPTSMICHTVYDTFEFFNTWRTANAQIEYADTKYQEELSPSMATKTRQMLKTLGVTKPEPILERLKRLFYTFDTDQNDTLSRSEVRRGLAYMAVERSKPPPHMKMIDEAFDLVDEDRNNRVDFAEFVNLYFKSRGPKPLASS